MADRHRHWHDSSSEAAALNRAAAHLPERK